MRSPTPLACDTQVKIEGQDVLMLGTVCRCEPQEGAYRIGIQLSAPLSSLIELELLNRALIESGRVEKVESPSGSHEEKNLGSEASNIVKKTRELAVSTRNFKVAHDVAIKTQSSWRLLRRDDPGRRPLRPKHASARLIFLKWAQS